ncbi:MAG: hypothetical protein ACLQDV_07395 [Candidatus Binataceae bacterium]
MRKIILLLMMAGVLAADPIRVGAQLLFGPAKMPPNWDARIPLPPKSTMIASTRPHPGENVYSAEFLGPRSYHDTVDFFETELPKAGFKMGPVTASPQRMLYQRTFTDGTVRDKLTIHTRPGDNQRLLTIFIEYTLPPGADTPSH